ncbi:MAG: chemotaxis protein CheA, partial [Proteobacteria bacterium]|nr:chemotaxis protein CheA [Pseudomonadota bacterium]
VNNIKKNGLAMATDAGADIESNELNEILEEFFTEADENLDTLEQDLIKLETLAETGGTDKETVDRIFRMLHTLKGGAGFLGLEKIAKLAHAGENLLDEVRNDKVQISKPVMDALLQTTDQLKQLLQFQKNREDDAGFDTEPLREVLEALATGKVVAPPAAAKPAVTVGPLTMDDVLNDPVLDPSRDKEAAAPAAKPAATKAVGGITMDDVLSDPALDPSKDVDAAAPKAAAPAAKPVIKPANSMVNADLLASVLDDPTLDPSRDRGDDPAPRSAAAVAAAVAAPAPNAATAAPAIPREAPAEQRKGEDRRQGGRRGEDGGNDTIRVETSRLDKVMNLVGELVLARNTLVRQLNLPETKAVLDRLENGGMIFSTTEQISLVTQDLQMSVLSTRMQPIKKVFDKIPRQVRELKTQLKKEVNLIIEGEMTEVDKSLVEELADPMVHMIRNALDHGLEGPDEREQAGKHPEGTLVVRAFYEGNNVVIQVQEDGRGIDPIKIRKVAVKKGVVTEAVAQAMSDAEAIRLIMAPGFSTAEKITDVSGRGVGMDVVNTKVMNLQGSIEITSELGMGTCFSIYMPLTLAIVNALIVGANEEGFAIPIGDISEVIRFKSEGIHRVNDQDVIELRGEPLPLYYLTRLTRRGLVKPYNAAPVKVEDVSKLKPQEDLTLDDLEKVVTAHTVKIPDGVKQARPNSAYVVIVRDGSSAMGLVVDALLGQEEVVVKPVTDAFEYNKSISGATITGDGKVHMILDVPSLLKGLAKGAHA